VAEGADDAATASNVIGTTTAEGTKTGMQALLAAQAQLGVKPKILGTPGLETQAVTAALAVIAKKLRGLSMPARWARRSPKRPPIAPISASAS
jgi:phage tail sheath protein FI